MAGNGTICPLYCMRRPELASEQPGAWTKGTLTLTGTDTCTDTLGKIICMI